MSAYSKNWVSEGVCIRIFVDILRDAIWSEDLTDFNAHFLGLENLEVDF